MLKKSKKFRPQLTLQILNVGTWSSCDDFS